MEVHSDLSVASQPTNLLLSSAWSPPSVDEEIISITEDRSNSSRIYALTNVSVIQCEMLNLIARCDRLSALLQDETLIGIKFNQNNAGLHINAQN